MDRRMVLAAAFAAGVGVAVPALAQDKSDAPKLDLAKIDLPKLPPDASVKQVTRVAGKTLNYTATVGVIPVRDEKGKVVAEVVFTAYMLDGPKGPGRPITFAFNGGPGAASVYLNLGAIGPKRLQFGAQGDSPSDPPILVDNAATWLDFTDLVFIDPVGTGFSRSLVAMEETKKRFFGVKEDVAYLSRVVYDWLLKNQRLASPKYVVGESYGGFRAPAIGHYLQRELGVAPAGMIMVSPVLDARLRGAADISPLSYMITLPSMAAAKYEREGKPLSPETLAEVEAYARGEFVTDMLKGQSDPAAVARIVERVTRYTGLDPALVRRMGGRIDTQTFLRELYRDQGRIASIYDANVTAYDPFPWSQSKRAGDPILDSIVASTTTAMADFTTRVVGWKVDGRYEALSDTVNDNWANRSQAESVEDLRQALAADPKLKVLIAHGYGDLSCPFFASRLLVDQMPREAGASRTTLALYPGGHMFYSRPGSMGLFRADVMKLYGAAG
ncbi:MAG: peptidase S10 [Alphaproteobacteria bacterium]|nr:peptidase S10 [Alphaproteobacteria bacterium]MBU1514046.1 peptidase S10 [Alphaproteobacteria bacterium]MBU2093014.1 peptidase S10 [Alphaproteobacteria bacterium]MBU2151783.1 peptidase S10 [Alphaproteobacteria bacterium]MBU2309397.1 peptidase S10 [Alphaproteobacteria bacterium]